MLRIRFFRTGRKKQPFYKIVVTDKNNPPASGRFVEDVGFYNPFTKECEIKKERVTYWIEKGAQPSDVVHNLLVKKEVIEGKKINVVSVTNKRKEKIAEKEEKNKQKAEESKKPVEEAETKEEEPTATEKKEKDESKEEAETTEKEDPKEETKEKEKNSGEKE